MTNEKVQQAIAHIKAGNPQEGGRLLREVLAANPGNELAWLWMSTLVPLDKKIVCLEKVLQINPGNTQAREQLLKLQEPRVMPQPGPTVSAPLPPPPVAVLEKVVPKAAEPPEPVTPSIKPHMWVNKKKDGADVILLDEGELMSFSVPQQQLPVLSQMLLQGSSMREVLSKLGKSVRPIHISLGRIQSVRELYNILTIQHRDSAGKDTTSRIVTSDKDTAEIIEALQQALGSRFEAVKRPTRLINVVAPVSILLCLACSGTGFFYWLANGLATEQSEIHGSATARGLGNLLLLLGPNGVLCIGGAIGLVLLLVLMVNIARPPTETNLVRSTAK